MRFIMWIRLIVLSALSSLFCVAATAHEVMPSIGDVIVKEDRLEFTFRLNAEAILADMSLDGLLNTQDAPQEDQYTEFLLMSPEDLEEEIQIQKNSIIGAMELLFDGEAVDLEFVSVYVEPADAVETGRSTFVVVSTALPSPRPDTFVYTWPVGFGDLVLRQHGVDSPYTGQLAGGDSTIPVRLSGGDARTGWQAFADYIPVGFDHILPKGLDHILFVLGLFFLSVRFGALLWQVSAFTLAHTVTLALGALGWVSVPGSIVEPLIALSIAFVAFENILTNKLHSWRPFVIFGFGLLHGLGFASVLGEFGLPEANFIPALIGFNVGVELGQLTVILGAFLAVGFWFGRKEWYRNAISIPASLIIGAVGMYWFVERAFLG